METLKFVYKYFKKSMVWAVIAEIFSWLGIFAELMLPLLSGMFIDFIIQEGKVEQSSGGAFHFLLEGQYGEVHTMKLFYSIAIVFVILIVIRIVLIYARDLIQEKVGLKLETELRYDTYSKLMELDSQTITAYNSGELLQVLNMDTIMFKEMFAHRIPYFLDAVFMLVTSLILIFGINFRFIVIPLILMPFLVVAVLDFKKKAKANFKEIRRMGSEMNLKTQENIAAVRIVRSFTNEDLEEAKFDEANMNLKDARMKQIWLSSKFDLTFHTISQIAFIGTIIIGALLVMKGTMTVGLILTTSSYIMRIMNNITSVNNHIFNMQQQTIAGAELKKFMEKESNIPDQKEANLHSDTPNIELHDVSLQLDGQDILKNINLSIPYGKKLGIVGETGSGKSMLMKTLVRIYDVTTGNITVDQHDIKDYSLMDLRNMYSYVFQDVFLFSNTIESNIAYSRADIDERMVTKSAENAQAAKFIDALADRYKTIVGERGLGISGGQKQRVSMARAFHKNAPVFILDDSTSALDVNTERLVLKNIHEHFNDKTVIITAHRFSSVVDCDEILYMKDGEISERGTFKELMALNGSFAHVYNIQQAQQAEEVDYDHLAEKGGAIHG